MHQRPSHPRRAFLRALPALAALAALAATTPRSAMAGPLEWSRWPMPYSRSNHVAILDPLRDRLVIHGGTGPLSNDDNDELWALELAGSPQWEWLGYSKEACGMQPRFRHLAVCDAPGDRMIVFGGQVGSSAVAETWQISLATHACSPCGSGSPPPASFNYVTALDSARRRMLVVGPNGAVHGLDLATDTWSAIPTGGTPFTAGPFSAAMDTPRDRLVVTTVYGVYQLALAGSPAWSQLVPPGPPSPPDVTGQLVFDPARDRMNLVRADGTVWALPMTGPPVWSQRPAAPLPPGPRSGVPVVLDAARDRLLLHGGQDFNDTWAYGLATDTWVAIQAGSPIPRGSLAAVVAPASNAMLATNGQSAWRFDLAAGVFEVVSAAGTPPGRRTGMAFIHDPVRQRMLVFGGADDLLDPHNDVHALSFDGSPAWSSLVPAGTAPAPRQYTQAVHDPVRDRMIVFGGSNDANFSLRDTWALSLQGTPTWSLVQGEGPPLKCGPPGAALFADASGDVAAGGTPAHDLRSVNIVEPRFADLGERIVLTLRTWAGDLANPPDRSVWRIFFDDTTGTDTTFFVGMTTCPSHAGTSFMYGYVDAPAGGVARTLGVPEAVSIVSGTDLKVTMRKVQVGTADGIGPVRWFVPLGASLTNVRAEIRETTGGQCADGALLDGGGSGTYVVEGNCSSAGLLDHYPGTPLVYDSRRDRIVLVDAEANGLTRAWALSLSAPAEWMPLAGGAPTTQRFYTSAAYDSANDRVLAYGGTTGLTSTLDDLLVLSLSPAEAWSIPPDPPGLRPLPRLEHSFLRDPAGGRFILFGGSETPRDDTDPRFARRVAESMWFLAEPTTVSVDPPGDRPGAAPPSRIVLTSCALSGLDRVRVAASLPAAGVVAIDVLDLQGRRLGRARPVATSAGPVEWSVALARAPAPGLYFVRLTQGPHAAARKLLVIR